jgi:hypothetical protein
MEIRLYKSECTRADSRVLHRSRFVMQCNEIARTPRAEPVRIQVCRKAKFLPLMECASWPGLRSSYSDGSNFSPYLSCAIKGTGGILGRQKEREMIFMKWMASDGSELFQLLTLERPYLTSIPHFGTASFAGTAAPRWNPQCVSPRVCPVGCLGLPVGATLSCASHHLSHQLSHIIPAIPSLFSCRT